jgi:hypothetical protein
MRVWVSLLRRETVALQALVDRVPFHGWLERSWTDFTGQFSVRVCIPVNEKAGTQEFWKLLLPALQMPALTDLYQGAFEALYCSDGLGEKTTRGTLPDLSLDALEGSVLSSR